MLTRNHMKCVLIVTLTISSVFCRPQGQQGQPQSNREAPMPYNFEWKVEDQESKNYYGQKEAGNEVGRVEGSYYVWLPDGRLMTVSYYVDGESGFVPTITYEPAANPFGG